jgi:hypothetical protein
VFTDAEHFDYLYGPKLPCRLARAARQGQPPTTDDLITMFFAKCLPPELWPNLHGLIPDNLVPPPLQLTPLAVAGSDAAGRKSPHNHHPAVVEDLTKHAEQTQLRIADAITKYAGSMLLSTCTSPCSPSGCWYWRGARGRR